jgi:pimeloyl-ACP methyl ester carboxylesterase
MLARLQQFTTVTLLLVAGLWAAWFVVQGRPVGAVLGAAAILLGYAAFLGAEFVMLACTHRGDPTPRAGAGLLLRAWWGEVTTAPRVFCWRQPFRSMVESDHLPAQPTGRRGVVLVHGFVCNRGLWNPWMRRLRSDGVAYIAVNLEPVFGSIDDGVPAIADAVRRMTQATGLAPLIVAHSMGGLAARAWRSSAGDASVAHRLITIGTPHQGTWLARFALSLNGRQMQQGSAWLARLQNLEAAAASGDPYAHVTCFFSHCDNIVFPPSMGTLPGADNRHVPATAHVHLAFHEDVYREVLRSLDSDAVSTDGSRMAQ